MKRKVCDQTKHSATVVLFFSQMQPYSSIHMDGKEGRTVSFSALFKLLYTNCFKKKHCFYSNVMIYLNTIAMKSENTCTL